MFDNVIIRASAGSGKTFQLSNRYLDLAFGGVAWDSVLASTFTRKAAGEILDRILIRLAKAALDDKERTELSKFLSMENVVSREKVFELLTDTIRNLHRLRVGTLDSFFIQIAGSFSLELGISPGWEIVDEITEKRYMNEAVHETFNKTPFSEAKKLMHMLFKGEASQSITQQVLDLSNKLVQLYRESSDDAWNKLEMLKPFSDEQMASIVEKYQQAEIPKTAKGANDQRFDKARNNDLKKIAEANWSSFVEGGFAKGIISGDSKYYGKPVEGELYDALCVLIQHARAHITNTLAGQTKATGELLKKITEHYERIKAKNHALRFADITIKLGRSQLQERLSQIIYRIDAQTKHLLLDEFQDTSPLQWGVLRPFVMAAIHSIKSGTTDIDGSFFCVGDTKQAVYGWRGGVAAIFNTIEREVEPLEKQSLLQSFRSAPQIIDTVNDLFQNLVSNDSLIAYENQNEYPSAAENWAKRFEEHQTARIDYPGFCTVEVAPLFEPEKSGNSDLDSALNPTVAEEDESNFEDEDDVASVKTKIPSKSEQTKTTLKYAVLRIAELHKETPWATIGVLVRENRTAARIIAGLKTVGIDASEEGGNPLTDSVAVETVLSALTLADHPGDTVCRYHLANGPLGPHLGITLDCDNAAAARASEKIRRSLLENGYGNVIADWIGVLAVGCDQRNLDRLLQLLNIAYAWDAKASIRADGFVNSIRSQKVESQNASNIRVMTIHKSKGLQFDIVVLPELDDRLIGQNPPVVVGRQKNQHHTEVDPTAPIDRILRFTSKIEQKLLPKPFQEMFDEYYRGQVEESLCLLYVALTRPIYRLCMMIPPVTPRKITTSPRRTFDGIIRSKLVSPGRGDAPETILYEYGNPDWFKHESFDAVKKAALELKKHDSHEIVRISLRENKSPHRNLSRISPSDLEGTAKTKRKFKPSQQSSEPETGQMAASRRDYAMLRGTVIHACFEKIEWLDRNPPDRAMLMKTVAQIAQSRIDDSEIEKIIDSFLEICKKPEVQTAFSHSGLPAADSLKYELFSERQFVVRWENEILRGSIDRLLVCFQENKAISAEITDYKTDTYREECGLSLDEFIAEHTEFYKPQLDAYRYAVSRLYGLKPENIAVKLLYTSPGKIIEVV